MKITILDGAVLNPGDVDWGPITALGDVTIYDETPADKLAERAKGVDVLLTNKTPLGCADLEKIPDVRMVGVLATIPWISPPWPSATCLCATWWPTA